MTRRKRIKAPKPILCPACATELPDAFIRASANSLAGRKDRPGAVGLVRNPTGKAKAELCDVCHAPLVFPADDDPMFIGDSAVTSLCRHVVRFRAPTD